MTTLSLLSLAEALVNAVRRSNDQVGGLISLATESLSTTVLSTGETVTITKFDLTNQANLITLQALNATNNLISTTSSQLISTLSTNLGQTAQRI